jgi:hypothetical protein
LSAWTSSCPRLDLVETEPAQIKLIDKLIDQGKIAQRIPSGSGLKQLPSNWSCLIAIGKLWHKSLSALLVQIPAVFCMSTNSNAPISAGYQIVHPERNKRSVSKFDSASNFVTAVCRQSSLGAVNFGTFGSFNHSNQR